MTLEVTPRESVRIDFAQMDTQVERLEVITKDGNVHYLNCHDRERGRWHVDDDPLQETKLPYRALGLGVIPDIGHLMEGHYYDGFLSYGRWRIPSPIASICATTVDKIRADQQE